MLQLGTGLKVEKAGHRLAVAPGAGQHRDRHAVDTSVVAEGQQHIHAAAFERGIQRVAGFVAGFGCRCFLFARPTFLGPHPAFLRDDDRDRLVDHPDFRDSPFLGLNQGPARIGELPRVLLDFLDHQAPQRRRAGKNFFEFLAVLAQLLLLLLDLDRFQPRQLPQADIENVVGLAFAEREARDQRLLRIVAAPDDGDHFVDVQQHQLTAFENMDPVQNLVQSVPRTALDRLLAELDPLGQHLPQRLLHRPAVQTDHRQVDRRRCLQAGLRQQRIDQLGLQGAAALWLAHQAHRGILVGLVAHRVQNREQRLLLLHLLRAQGFFPGLDFRIGDFFDLFEHPLGADARRQLRDHELPLAARQFLDLPARPHFQRATAGEIGIGDLGGAADDLAAAREIGAWHQREQFAVGEFGRLDQRDAGVCNFTQVVAGNLGGQAHGNAAGAIEQRERQPRRQLAGLLRAAVVIGHELHRALVDLIEQQVGDARQPRLGVTHGGRAVAVPAAEVSLAVDQRIALRKTLRHAHQRVICGLVAVRVEPTQHIADHARALHRLGAARARKTKAHARHGIQNAALHRFLAIAHVG